MKKINLLNLNLYFQLCCYNTGLYLNNMNFFLPLIFINIIKNSLIKLFILYQHLVSLIFLTDTEVSFDALRGL